MRFLLVLFCLWSQCNGLTHLLADGVTDTYRLIDSYLLKDINRGSVIEVPDCNHTTFGPHITQIYDSTFQRPVFAFHSHIRQDDDRCQKFDRQRTEIKTYDQSPDELLGFYGDNVTFSWNFKLDSGFQPPYSFCHIHQLKAAGGDDSMPIITLTTRRSTPNLMQLLQYDSRGNFHFLKEEPLDKFLGVWVHAQSNVTYGHDGAYIFTAIDVTSGRLLMEYKSDNIDFWRNETHSIRPKWGIYRSVQEAVLGRNETVLFDDFCIGKGPNDRCI